MDIETLAKDLDKKLDDLKQDVSEKAIEAAKKAADEMVKKAIADLSKHRDMTTYAGLKTEREDTVGAFAEYGSKGRFSVSLPQYMKDMNMTNLKALAGFSKAIWQIEHRKGEVPEGIKKAMGGATGSTGGFILYEEFEPDVKRLIIEDQVVRPRAQIVPMSTDTLWYPKIVDTSHATSIHGGIRGTWAAEGSDLSATEADPNFGQFRLIAKKFDDFVKVSNELVMDSPISLIPLLGQLLREGLGFFEDFSALYGTGAGQMLGIYNSGAAIGVARATASHFTMTDAVGMMARLFPSSYKRACWAISPGVLPDFWTLQVGGYPVMISNIPGQTGVEGTPFQLLGLPVVVSEKMKDLGTKFDVLLADYSYYIIGDRMDVTLTSSDQRYFEEDRTAFKIIERLDGAPWLDSPLTPNNGGATLSPFVYLTDHN